MKNHMNINKFEKKLLEVELQSQYINKIKKISREKPKEYENIDELREEIEKT